jgi:hypothetical protein
MKAFGFAPKAVATRIAIDARLGRCWVDGYSLTQRDEPGGNPAVRVGGRCSAATGRTSESTMPSNREHATQQEMLLRPILVFFGTGNSQFE